MDERRWLTEVPKQKEEVRLLRDMKEYIGSSQAEDDDDAEGDIILDKKVHEETSDSESELDEQETLQNLHGRDNIVLPLDRSS